MKNRCKVIFEDGQLLIYKCAWALGKGERCKFFEHGTRKESQCIACKHYAPKTHGERQPAGQCENQEAHKDAMNLFGAL